ncbi:MAG: EF-hand domain-containing protein [Hylemonella sp.]|nr:EF-hand domain-containing protein [Hylemonella sp.]
MSTITSVNSSSDAWAAASAKRAQHQAKMFAKVDTDSSGSVDQTELDTMLNDISQKTGASLGESKELFSQIDSNSDGNLSSDELSQGMKQIMPPPSTVDFAQSRQTGGAKDDLFSKIDSDSDGSLDADEIKAFAAKVKSDTGEDITTKLSKLDTDADGALSKTEFEAGKPSRSEGISASQAAGGPHGAGGPPPAGEPGGTSPSDSASKTYDPLDINQDGTVSEMERLAGALKDLAQSDGSNSGIAAQSEIAKLAQKLYDQISANFMSESSQSSVSTLA